MSEKRYVLRAREFGYDDEYYDFYGDGIDGRINSIFNEKELALKAWKELERETLKIRPLSSIQELFEQDDAKLMELDQFLFERSGVHFLDDDNYVIEEIENTIATLDENVVFEFLEKAELLSFCLVEFDDKEQFYVAWLSETGAYRAKEDYGQGDGDELYFSQDRAEAVKECCEDYIKGGYEEDRESPLVFEGTLELLSDSPALLRTAIASHDNLSYDEDEGTLLVDNYDAQALAMILPLLKNPPLEIRPVTIDELCAIQANLCCPP